MRSSWPVCLILCVLIVQAQASEFNGWQSMEVIKLDDARATRGGMQSSSAQVRLGDIDGDGRNNIIVIKRRQSLINWYAYVAAADRQAAQDPVKANEVPLSPRLKLHEIRLERLPRDVVVLAPNKIAVLVGPPDRLEIYQRADEHADWVMQQKIAILPAEPAPGLEMLFIKKQNQLLIPTDGGIQLLDIGDELKVSWLRPRDNAVPWRWFLNDLDGDGDEDLVCTYGGGVETIVWRRYEAGFRPPQAIYEQKIRDAVVLGNKSGGSDVLIIDAIGDALLRRYQLQAGKEQRFGQRRALGLPGQQSPWLGVRLGKQRALVAYDPDHPQLLVYPFADHDWQKATSFPCIDQIEAMIAPQAQPGVILLKRKNDSELYKSEWVNGRFSFPQPWQPQAHAANDTKLLQIGAVSGFVWWTQKQDDDVVLFRWADGDESPLEFRYPGQGKKIEHAIWLGGEMLLAKDSFKRDGRILNMLDGAATENVCAHLKNINVDEYRAQENHLGEIVPARLSGGVLRWLDGQLHAVDQIMLDDGLRIDDYVVINQQQYVLQADSRQMISLRKDDSGVMRGDQRFDIPGGFSLAKDPVLGLCALEPGWICRLDKGQAWTLQSLEHVDEREAQPAGLQELRYNRLFPVDVQGSDIESFIVSDDERHRLNLFKRGTDGTTALASWQVFEDSAYPYGMPQRNNEQREPRVVKSIQFDNDEVPDLVLLCHDRLLLYLSQKQ